MPHAVGLDLERHVDSVARGARDLADNDPLRPGERVDDRRLADVGSADNGDVQRRLGGGLAFFAGFVNRLGQVLRQPAHRLANGNVDAPHMQRANGENVLKTKLGELGDPPFVRGDVHLVDHHEHRLAGFAQHPGDLEIHRHDALLHADNKQNHVHVIERDLHLGDDLPGEVVAAALALEQADAAGVHQRERMPQPLDLGAKPVARDAGTVVYDRNPLARNTIEQGRLPDIGPTDDGYHSWHAAIVPRTRRESETAVFYESPADRFRE